MPVYAEARKQLAEPVLAEILIEEEDQGPIAEVVRRLRDLAPVGVSTSDADDSVLLDVKIDGLRCLLLRQEPQGADALSPREREIARLVAKGYPNKVIAGILDISCWTVGTHLRRIFAKLGTTSRAAMVSRLHESR